MSTTIRLASSIARLEQVYKQAFAVRSGSLFTTVNELTDQLPAVRPETLKAAVDALLGLGPIIGNKLLSEEDKGAILMGLISVAANKPLAMARWYTYPLPVLGSVVVPVKMEYAKGHLIVNGISEGDHLTLVDDTLSTGGTALSLIQAAHLQGATVVEMRVVVEKLGYGGRQRLKSEFGLDVKAVMGISISGTGEISVDEILGKPVR